MTRFDAETCSVAWPGLELAIHNGTVRDLAFVSRASGTPVLVSGGAGTYHFCMVLLLKKSHFSHLIELGPMPSLTLMIQENINHYYFMTTFKLDQLKRNHLHVQVCYNTQIEYREGCWVGQFRQWWTAEP